MSAMDHALVLAEVVVGRNELADTWIAAEVVAPTVAVVAVTDEAIATHASDAGCHFEDCHYPASWYQGHDTPSGVAFRLYGHSIGRFPDV